MGAPDDTFFRTNDMAMVTYLRMNGHSVQACAYEADGDCWWQFLACDAITDLYNDFTQWKALVEPREYSKHFSATKREFHAAGRARYSTN
jgi:hypothetical protein